MNICKKCDSEFEGNYCPVCGHQHKLERINGRYIITEIASVLNFQKGILYTIKELLIRPGKNIREFIAEDRKRLVKPIVFILITSLIYTLIVRFFHSDKGLIDGTIDALNDTKPTIQAILKWIQGNYDYANIIVAVFIGIWLKVFFRKYPFNFFEILVLLCFIIGIGMLIYAIFEILDKLSGFDLQVSGIVVAFVYTTFAIGQFFDKRKITNYVKAIISYFLGMITFTFVAIAIGLLFDFLNH